jgi:hypothetical protein
MGEARKWVRSIIMGVASQNGYCSGAIEMADQFAAEIVRLGRSGTFRRTIRNEHRPAYIAYCDMQKTDKFYQF